MAKLSESFGRLAYRYDAIVVGSGYGGAIAAARLAEQGLSVCVLERGREWATGEFPADERALASAVRTPLNPLGLLDANVQTDNDMDVVVGCGLGGTSLVNAGISLRPEEDVFHEPEWPRAIREAHADGSLWGYYARAEAMLGANRDASIFELGKVKAHGALVSTRGVAHDVVPLNVTRSAHTRHGVVCPACTHCGDCIGGCNVGAKNTLVTNYLPFAKRRGARIFTEVDVRRLEREPPFGDHEARRGDWIVHFDVARGAHRSTKQGTVRARIVVLGAGSLGSTEILLRSRDELGFSSRLGARFSANADIMAMSYNGGVRTNVLAYGATAGNGWHVGPSIASFGDFRRGGPLDGRFLILEGVIPSALQTTVGRAFGAWAMLRGDLTAEQRARITKDLLPPGVPTEDGALNHSLLFLACGHDGGSGRLVLKDADARVVIEWPGASDEPCFARITDEMRALAEAHGGVFVPNPRSTIFGGSRQMTVHPLGGCPMGDDPEHGVTDDRGRVFTANGDVHEGLYVTDGAIVPRSLGVTPLLTISALAERAVEAIALDALPGLNGRVCSPSLTPSSRPRVIGEHVARHPSRTPLRRARGLWSDASAGEAASHPPAGVFHHPQRLRAPRERREEDDRRARAAHPARPGGRGAAQSALARGRADDPPS